MLVFFFSPIVLALSLDFPVSIWKSFLGLASSFFSPPRSLGVRRALVIARPLVLCSESNNPDVFCVKFNTK